MSFAGKVVLVTGAGSVIGASTAVLFAREGADVVFVGTDGVQLNNVLMQCRKYGIKYLPIKADITRTDDAVLVVKKIMDNFGKIDVLVNNGDICKFGGISDLNFMGVYDETMNTNLRAQVHMTHLLAPLVIKSKGCIVNISSVASVTVKSNFNALAYYVSKAGLNHFTRAIALELAQHGVRVNSISPGPVWTEIFENANITITTATLGQSTALNRVSEADEIGELVLYLASDKAKSITGSDYVCDNGYLLKN